MAFKYHVVAFRRSRGKSGRITQVEHEKWGWMPIGQYYALQKLHDIPWGSLIEGAYRLKMAIFSVEIEILGTDVPVPIGAGLMSTIAGKIALSLKDNRPDQAALWSAMLALPFGEIAAIWVLTHEALGISEDFLGSLLQGGLPGLFRPEPVILPPRIIGGP